MATTNLKLVMDLVDNVSSQIRGVADNVDKNFDSMVKSAQNVGRTMTVIGGAVTGALGLMAREAIIAESQINRLTRITQNATGASDDQIKSLINQARALENVGVVSAGNIINAQAQLATFDLQIESIKTLTPALLDYAVAERGVAVSSQELQQFTNGLAQALQGNFGALTRSGFILDETTKNLIANGNETERVQALVEVLNSTYRNFNSDALLTAEGQIQRVRNQFAGMAETIGAVLLPHIARFTEILSQVVSRVAEWAEANPVLFERIVMVVGALGLFMAIVGPILIALPTLIAGIKIAGAMFLALTSPIGIVIALSTALIALLWQQTNGFEALRAKVVEVWAFLSEKLSPAFQQFKNEVLTPLIAVVAQLGSYIMQFAVASLRAMWDTLMIVIEAIKTTINESRFLSDLIQVTFAVAMNAGAFAVKVLIGAFNGLVSVLQFAVNLLGTFVNLAQGIGGVISSVRNAVSGAGSAVSDATKLKSRDVAGNRAVGGPVSRNSSYLVGENGPEIFTPSANGKISHMGGGVGITVNITGNNISNRMDLDDIANQVGDQIIKRLQLAYRI